MADRPILFSAPMVRALLAGTKTQTRRVIDPQPREWQAKVIDIAPPSWDAHGTWGQIETVWRGPLVPGMCEPDHDVWHPLRGVRHRVGERLWVRETWAARMTHGWTIADARSGMYQKQILYRADSDESIDGWWPSIHMPREFSRITLTVTEVRVQQLHEISEADAIAEGVERLNKHVAFPIYRDYGALAKSGPGALHSARASYSTLWNHINGPGSWQANPWVAAYSFSVALGNIDSLPRPMEARDGE